MRRGCYSVMILPAISRDQNARRKPPKPCHPTRILSPNFHAGATVFLEDPADADHPFGLLTLFPSRALGMGHRENERGFPHQQGGGRASRTSLASPGSRSTLAQHSPRLAHPGQQEASQTRVVLSRNLIPLMQPVGKCQARRPQEERPSRSNFLGPSALAGALWVSQRG